MYAKYRYIDISMFHPFYWFCINHYISRHLLIIRFNYMPSRWTLRTRDIYKNLVLSLSLSLFTFFSHHFCVIRYFLLTFNQSTRLNYQFIHYKVIFIDTNSLLLKRERERENECGERNVREWEELGERGWGKSERPMKWLLTISCFSMLRNFGFVTSCHLFFPWTQMYSVPLVLFRKQSLCDKTKPRTCRSMYLHSIGHIKVLFH